METGAVVEEILDELKELRRRLATDPALDETSVLEAHKWIFSMLRTGLDTQVWSDTGRPRFTDIVGPYHKWGGDNADAFYCYAPLDPARRYRISGRRGDAVYFSLTVYGGPDDGRYSERIVASVNDRELDVAEDGTFEILLGPDEKTRLGPVAKTRLEPDEKTRLEPDEKTRLEPVPKASLEPDAVCVITRDYVADPRHDRRTEWHIECLDPPAEPRRDTDADLARRFRAALTWLREQSKLVLPLEDDNRVDEPYPVPTETFGWAAGDAAYAMGVFALADDEALVIEGRSPECAFWNLCLWNPFLHTYDYDQERVTINGHQIAYEPDGSWRIVIAAGDPGHPNWVSTAGHARGRLWFRWFLPARTPERPRTRVVRLSDHSL